MRKKIIAVMMAVLVTGTSACGNKTETNEVVTPTASVVVEQTSEAADHTTKTLPSADGEVELEELQTLAKQADLQQATRITVSDGQMQIEGSGCENENGTLRITEAGTYVISGTLENGSILVDAEKESRVYLVLNGVEITNPKGAAIYGKKAETLVITLADGTKNVLTDGREYVFEEGEDEPDATLFAKQDVMINGEGTLIVNANYGDAIKGKDSLYLFSGSYEIHAEDEGITGKDLLYIQNGTYTIQSVGDALKASNDTDETLGNLVIENGTFTISSEDDAIHAENGLIIYDGEITVTESYEGLEGAFIDIYGGRIDIKAEDDGINAAGGSSENTQGMFGFGGMMSSGNYEMNFHGGTICVDATGDGLDANGKISMNGGTLVVYGPENGANGALDYDSAFVINGGTLLVTGSAGMAQAPSGASAQNTISAVFPTVQQAGSEVSITSADGTLLDKMTIPKQFQQFVYSSAELKTGETYTLSVNGEALLEGTIENAVTSFGNAGTGGFGGFGGGGFGKGGFSGGELPEGFEGGFPGGELPEGFEGGFPGGELPEGFEGGFPEGELPEGFEGGFLEGELPEGFEGRRPERGQQNGELPEDFYGGSRPEKSMPSGQGEV